MSTGNKKRFNILGSLGRCVRFGMEVGKPGGQWLNFAAPGATTKQPAMTTNRKAAMDDRGYLLHVALLTGRTRAEAGF